MKTYLILTFLLISFNLFSQKTKVYSLDNGKKFTEKVYNELINDSNFKRNYKIYLKDSLISTDKIIYFVDVIKKDLINYKLEYIKVFNAKYLPYNEQQFAESQMLTNSIIVSQKDNYYLNPDNLLFQIIDYSYTKTKNIDNLEIFNSISVYYNKEVIILTPLHKSYNILVRKIDDDLFQNIKNLSNKEVSFLIEDNFIKDNLTPISDNFSYIKINNSEILFSSDNLKNQYFDLIKNIRSLEWKDSFNVTINEEDCEISKKIKNELKIKHHKLNLPINSKVTDVPIEVKEK